jgi:hypothetical protein
MAHLVHDIQQQLNEIPRLGPQFEGRAEVELEQQPLLVHLDVFGHIKQ